ncbi:MAG TPA: N-acetylmuramic acid 6-phosphate etherase [Kofleriaceae bacterium]|jgi:N-acetylmuramic acid 6-phosphate etherase
MIPVDDDKHGTEDAARRFRGLDSWPTAEILEALWTSQSDATAACMAALPALQRAVDGAVERLTQATGRLVYAGAGSSGMIAALDAYELGPTFNWPAARMVVFLAGGFDLSREPDGAAEDDATGGRIRARDARLGTADVVLGISASGASAYTVAVIEEARAHGAMTIAVASRADSPLVRAADHAVVVATGAEVIAGSTRLAAGTAQKLVLNLFSTAVMVRLGGVFDNLMIEVRATNAKLRQRQAAIVASIAGVDAATAGDALARHGDVKRAVLALSGRSGTEIDAALARAGGNLRVALGRTARPRSDR